VVGNPVDRRRNGAGVDGWLGRASGKMAPVILAVAPLTDVRLWARSDGLEIVLYLTGAVLLTRFATWLERRITESIDARDQNNDVLVRSEAAKHRHAVTQVLTWATLVLLYCVTAVLVVEKLGVPITGLVAPATVVGVALGFGAQRLVQDVLAGFFIVAERQYGFGDVLSVSFVGTATVTGTVEDVTLRTTRLRSINGEVYIVPNGQIAFVTNLSRDWARAVIDVPLPVATDAGRAIEVLREVAVRAYEDEELRPLLLDPPTVLGVESLSVEEYHVRLLARTLPGKQFEVGPELRWRITSALRQAGITVSLGAEGGTDVRVDVAPSAESTP
jgi:moderate conductance mechanosensitive channel